MRSRTITFICALFLFHAGTLLAAVDLKVTANPSPALPGERIEYTLTVTNTGTTQVTGVRLESLFPESVTVNKTTLNDIGEGGDCPGFSCDTGERISWDIGELAAQAARTVHYEANVVGVGFAPDEGSLLTTQVDLLSDDGDVSVSNDVTVTLVPGLELTLAADRDPVVPGETLTYVLAYGNRGTANQLNTRLRVSVPDGASYVADSASAGGSLVNGAVEWDLGTVLVGASGEQRFTVAIDSGASPGDVIQAEAQLLNSLTQALRVRAEAVTRLTASIPVQLLMTANPNPALPGERIEYTLTVTNTGSTALTGLVVKSLFPALVAVNKTNLNDIGEGGDCPGFSCDTGERITWDLSVQPLPANSSRTLHYEAVVGTGSQLPLDGSILSSRALLAYDGGTGSVRNDVRIEHTPGLELVLAADRDPAVPGETLTYVLNYGNRGATNQLNTKLRVPVPAGTSYVADSANEGGILVNGAVEWDLGTVLAGTSGERRFTVTVDGGTPGEALQADAQLVDSQTLALRVRAELDTRLAASTPVQLFMTANPKPALPGERVEYALTVTNTGSTAVTGLVVKSLFPALVAVNKTNLNDIGEGGDCPGFSCDTGERITWDLSVQPLPANSSRTLHYEVVVGTGSQLPPDGSILSTLALLVYEGGAGSVRGDVRIEHTSGLELTLAADRAPVVPGETLTYVLNFGNRGVTNQLNTKLRMAVPAGTIFISSPGGSVVNGVVEWDLGTLLAGGNGERRFSVAVDGVGAAGEVIQARAQLTSDMASQQAEVLTRLETSIPVQLFMTANPKPALPGERIEHTLTITNTGSTAVTGLVVKSLFPASVSVNKTNLNDTGEGGDCPGFSCDTNEWITWDLSIQPLPANSSRTLHYEMVVGTGFQAPPDGSILSTLALLVYDGGAGSARDDIRVDTVPGLNLAIAADRNPVAPGEQLTYRMVFGNPTSSVEKNLRLTVPIPPGSTLISASPGVTRTGNVLAWDMVDAMIAGAIDERSFTVSVDPGAIFGDAFIIAAQLVDTMSSLIRAESVTSTAVQKLPDVRLSIAATPSPQVQGVIVYRLSLANTSSQTVSGINVKNLFPKFVTVQKTALSDGGDCPGFSCDAGERITWDFNVEPLAANSSRTVLFDAVMRTSSQAPPDGTVLSNQATVSYDASSGTEFGSVSHHFGVGIDIDSDRDSLPDSWERSNFGNLNQGPGGDADGDGLTNRNEFLTGANPKDKDTDGDTLPDGYEFDHGLNPVTAADASEDLDGDGFSNLEEFVAGTDPSNDADAPTFLSGTIKTDTGEDVCALVLASGRFMFSCNPNGVFSIKGLPREKNGTFKRQIYADGFFPRVVVLPDSVDEAVVMTRSGACPKYNPPTTPGFFPDAAGKRLTITGKVLLPDNQTPICAMALANGQFTFTCDGSGSYALNIPMDGNGQFKLQVYADGFAPTIQIFDKNKANNDVRMARASECQAQ